ncbi:hypothetical protein ACO0QE_003244 [Hanseniaspora vineae]
MSAHTLENASILTEHFGFPPISLVDDIINSVNMLMYKCTEAMEDYLLKTVDNAYDNDVIDVSKREAYLNEIKEGTSKLESTLENAVDVHFDKLELYLLRNVLNVPHLDTRFFRLRHQLGLRKIEANTEEKLQLQISELCTSISEELQYNKMLQEKLTSFKKLESKIRNFKSAVSNFFALSQRSAVSHGSLSSDLESSLTDALGPIDKGVQQVLQFLNEMEVSNADMRGEKTHDINQIDERLKEMLDPNNDAVVNTGSRLQYLNTNYSREAEESDRASNGDGSPPLGDL